MKKGRPKCVTEVFPAFTR